MHPPAVSVNVVPHDGGEILRLGGGMVVRISEDGSRTDNRIGAVHITMPPHTPGPEQHWHHMHDEAFLILSGTVRFTTATTIHDAHTGDYVVVPPLAPHTFSNELNVEATLHCSFTPAYYINYFRLIDQMAARNGGQLSKEDSVEAMGRYATLQVDIMAGKEI